MNPAVMVAPDIAMTAPAAVFRSWSCCARPPNSIAHPDQLDGPDGDWLSATVPGTVAAALHAAGRWDHDRPADLDGQDWWYRTRFDAPNLPPGRPCHLCFDGLATLAEVWLNGRCLLSTDNMFRAYRIDVAPHLRPHNELAIAFRSLTAELKKKRPRPRWKTNLVNHQQLRWQRTSLLGRIPGWSPPVPPVGPWRAVRLDTRPFVVSGLRLRGRLHDDDGIVSLYARLDSTRPPERVALVVGGHEADVEIQADAGGWLLRAMLRIRKPPRWWPHTHGAQPLTECTLRLHIGGEPYTIDCGSVGFRRLRVVGDGGLTIHVNDVPIYCRGACWTVSDIFTLIGTEESLARDLRLARDAGVNMLRVGGTMTYESDAFYRLCDERGILVWQDFMFANMDYPVEDPDYLANIESEAREQLCRLASHPCLTVLCGNSEVEQQAAMLGVSRELWRNEWFDAHLPELCGEYAPEVGYVPSTPSGGAMPFHVRDGVAHYYGIGAYQRSPAELRRDDVKFTPECLAFANVPESETVRVLAVGDPPVLHHPRWKRRVPRDTGAGWDFDDVRDFYLQQLFAVDPARLRSFDPSRYVQLSRVVPGEMMARAFAEWRSGHSNNRGALVWFFKDLWPAAGWGVIDGRGAPKAAYYYLRRSWQSRQITATDEGLDGMHLHVINEAPQPLDAHVELLLLKDGHIVVARGEAHFPLPARARRTIASDALLDGFHDVTYAYRFGPPQHDLAIATLSDARREVLSEAFYFVQPREPSLLPAANVNVEMEEIGEGRYQIALCCDRFLQGVSFDVPGFLPDDNYFHLAPLRRKIVCFSTLGDRNPRFRGSIEALNLRSPVAIRPKATPT